VVDIRHITTITAAISTPADTAAATIYETTITTTPAHNTISVTTISKTAATLDQLNHVADTCRVSTPPTSVPNQLEHKAATTTAISIMAIEQRDSRELATGRGEQQVRRTKEDEAREPEADQQEELDKEQEGIEESQDEV
jgi:hypothetical protein